MHESLSEQHTPPTRHALLQEAVERLAAAKREHPRRNAEWMLCEVLGCSRAMLYAHADEKVEPDQAARFGRMVERRMRGEPVQYIVGHTDFYGLQIHVTPDVLIPRPETEEVVTAALEVIARVERPRVLDAGTGSGCIALAIKQEHPDAEVWACDVHPKVLSVAKANADHLGLKVNYLASDILAPEAHDAWPNALDVLVSNPPYVPETERGTLAEEVHDFEPHAALFTGPDPLAFYRALARHGSFALREQGHLVLETHMDYAQSVAELLKVQGYTQVHVQRDLSGRDRIVTARKT